MNTTTTKYKDADEAYEAGNNWVQTSNRVEKLDFLMETCVGTDIFDKDTLLNEMVKFMNQDDFNEFFNHLRRNWSILTPQELDFEMNS